MPKTTFVNGSLVTADWLNAITNGPIFDGQALDGHAPPIENDDLSDAAGQIKPEWSGFRDSLKVTAGTGLSVNYTAGSVFLPNGALFSVVPSALVVPDNSTFNVFVSSTGSILASTAPPLNRLDLAKVTTAAGAVTNVIDLRPRFIYVFPPDQSGISGLSQGRLTLQSGNATPSTELTARTTLHYTPYTGNQIGLWDASNGRWVPYSFDELNLPLTGLIANTVYDVFIWNNNGVLTLEPVAWSDSSAGNSLRSGLVTQLNGIWVKDSDKRRLLGTLRTTSSIGQSEFSNRRKFLANIANQVDYQMIVSYEGSSWVPNSVGWRMTDNDPNKRLEVVFCLDGYREAYQNLGFANFSGLAPQFVSGVHANRFDSTNPTSSHSGFNSEWYGTANTNQLMFSAFFGSLKAGYNYFQGMENCNVANNANIAFDGGVGAGTTSAIYAKFAL